MANEKMHTLVIGDTAYDVYDDEAARADVAMKKMPSLTSGADLNSITAVGYYLKDSAVRVENGVNTARAKILCFNAPGTIYGLVQVWFDTTNNVLYFRTKNTPSTGWSEWVRMAEHADVDALMHGDADIIQPTNALPSDANQVYALWDNLMATVKMRRVYTSGTDTVPYITKQVLGTVSGYDYPVYTVDFAPVSLNTSYLYTDTDEIFTRKRVLIIASIHGDEPVPALATFECFKHLLTSKHGFEDLKQYVFDVIPVGNPWGYSHSLSDASGAIVSAFNLYKGGSLPEGYSIVTNPSDAWRGIRYNEAGYDINRDFADSEYTDSGISYGFKTLEAQYIKSLMENDYEFIVDFHMGGGTGNIQPFTDVCVFSQINAKPTNASTEEYAELKNNLLSLIAKCGSALDNRLHKYLGMTDSNRGFYPWNALGASNGTVTNYFAGSTRNTEQEHLVKAGITTELSEWCKLYAVPGGGENPERWNPTTHLIGANYIARLLDAVASTDIKAW